MPAPDATPRPLHDWIRTAAFDLCDEAKAHVHAEYEARHALQVAAALASGVPPAAVLGALGNPNRLQARLRAQYPTPAEARRLNAIVHDLQEPLNIPLLAAILIPINLYASTYLLLGVGWGRLLALTLAVNAWIVLFFVSRKRVDRLWRRRLSLRAVLKWRHRILLLLPAPAFVFALFHGTLMDQIITTAVPVLLALFDRTPRIIRKLASHPELEAGFEPANALSTESLEAWLALATADLTPEARRRAAAEITAHYHDACDTGNAGERPLAAASRATLAALGDPEDARRHFLKAYPTLKDLKRLEILRARYSRRKKQFWINLFVIILYTLLCLGALWDAVSNNQHDPSGVLLLLVLFLANHGHDMFQDFRAWLILAPQAPGLLKRHYLATVGACWALLVLPPLTMIFFSITGFTSPFEPQPGYSAWLAMIFAITAATLWAALLGWEATRYLPLLRKLREAPESGTPQTEGPDLYA